MSGITVLPTFSSWSRGTRNTGHKPCLSNPPVCNLEISSTPWLCCTCQWNFRTPIWMFLHKRHKVYLTLFKFILCNVYSTCIKYTHGAICNNRFSEWKNIIKNGVYLPDYHTMINRKSLTQRTNPLQYYCMDAFVAPKLVCCCPLVAHIFNNTTDFIFGEDNEVFFCTVDVLA